MHPPSPALLRALRGMLFGTTCSFLVLAEERRRRIRIARGLANRARAINQAKRHYRKGTLAAALAAGAIEGVVWPGGGGTGYAAESAAEIRAAAPAPVKRRRKVAGEALTRAEWGGLSGEPEERPVHRLRLESEPSPVPAGDGAHSAEDYTTTSNPPTPVWQLAHNPHRSTRPTHPPSIHSPFPLLGHHGSRKLPFSQRPGEHVSPHRSFGTSPVAQQNVDPPGHPSAHVGGDSGIPLSGRDRILPEEASLPHKVAGHAIERALADADTDAAIQQFRQMQDSLGPSAGRADWFIRLLVRAGMRREAVDVFQWAYAGAPLPSPLAFYKRCKILLRVYGGDSDYDYSHRIGGQSNSTGASAAADSAADAANPDRVLAMILDMSKASGIPVSGRIVARLLDAFMDMCGDYSRLKEIYQSRLANSADPADPASPALTALSNPSPVLMCLIGHGAQAGDVELVERLVRNYSAKLGNPEINGLLIGKMQLARAKAGDWDAVKGGFVAMKMMMPADSSHLDMNKHDFAAIFNEFVRTHGAAEVEYFCRVYVEELGLVLGPGMVSAVTDLYAGAGDLDAFGNWIRLCIRQGFGRSQALMWAILDACVKHWRYGHRGLAFLRHRLSAPSSPAGRRRPGDDRSGNPVKRDGELFSSDPLDPVDPLGPVDPVDPLDHRAPPQQYQALAGRYLQRQRGISRPQPSMPLPWALQPSTAPAEAPPWNKLRKQVRRKMVYRKWEAVLEIYNTALERGVVPADGFVNFAVNAALVLEGGSGAAAWAVVEKAQQAGAHFPGAMCNLLMTRLREIEAGPMAGQDGSRYGTRPKNASTQIKEMLDEVSAKRLPLPGLVSNRAARICLSTRSYLAALQICHLVAVLEREKADREARNYDCQDGRARPVQRDGSAELELLTSEYNFANLVFGLSASRRYDELALVLSRVENGTYGWKSDNVTMDALERAVRRLRACVASAASVETEAAHRGALERTLAGLRHIKEARLEFFGARRRGQVDQAIWAALGEKGDVERRAAPGGLGAQSRGGMSRSIVSDGTEEGEVVSTIWAI